MLQVVQAVVLVRVTLAWLTILLLSECSVSRWCMLLLLLLMDRSSGIPHTSRNRGRCYAWLLLRLLLLLSSLLRAKVRRYGVCRST